MSAPNFEIIEGAPESSVILHVPHSARTIPSEIRSQLLLDDLALAAELDEMTDSRTDELAQSAGSLAKIKPWIFHNLLSRLVFDPERFPDDREVMNQIGMGVVYQRSSLGAQLRLHDPIRDSAMIEEFFHPYAQAFDSLVRQVLHARGAVTIIDVHSYRMEEHHNGINKGQRRPPLCLGVDDFHTPPWLLQMSTSAFSEIGEVIINEPYAGTYVPLSLYQRESQVTSVMMENREDGLVGGKIATAARALAELINGIERSR